MLGRKMPCTFPIYSKSSVVHVKPATRKINEPVVDPKPQTNSNGPNLSSQRKVEIKNASDKVNINDFVQRFGTTYTQRYSLDNSKLWDFPKDSFIYDNPDDYSKSTETRETLPHCAISTPSVQPVAQVPRGSRSVHPRLLSPAAITLVVPRGLAQPVARTSLNSGQIYTSQSFSFPIVQRPSFTTLGRTRCVYPSPRPYYPPSYPTNCSSTYDMTRVTYSGCGCCSLNRYHSPAARSSTPQLSYSNLQRISFNPNCRPVYPPVTVQKSAFQQPQLSPILTYNQNVEGVIRKKPARLCYEKPALAKSLQLIAKEHSYSTKPPWQEEETTVDYVVEQIELCSEHKPSREELLVYLDYNEEKSNGKVPSLSQDDQGYSTSLTMDGRSDEEVARRIQVYQNPSSNQHNSYRKEEIPFYNTGSKAIRQFARRAKPKGADEEMGIDNDLVWNRPFTENENVNNASSTLELSNSLVGNTNTKKGCSGKKIDFADSLYGASVMDCNDKASDRLPKLTCMPEMNAVVEECDQAENGNDCMIVDHLPPAFTHVKDLSENELASADECSSHSSTISLDINQPFSESDADPATNGYVASNDTSNDTSSLYDTETAERTERCLPQGLDAGRSSTVSNTNMLRNDSSDTDRLFQCIIATPQATFDGRMLSAKRKTAHQSFRSVKRKKVCESCLNNNTSTCESEAWKSSCSEDTSSVTSSPTLSLTPLTISTVRKTVKLPGKSREVCRSTKIQRRMARMMKSKRSPNEVEANSLTSDRNPVWLHPLDDSFSCASSDLKLDSIRSLRGKEREEHLSDVIRFDEDVSVDTTSSRTDTIPSPSIPKMKTASTKFFPRFRSLKKTTHDPYTDSLLKFIEDSIDVDFPRCKENILVSKTLSPKTNKTARMSTASSSKRPSLEQIYRSNLNRFLSNCSLKSCCAQKDKNWPDAIELNPCTVRLPSCARTKVADGPFAMIRSCQVILNDFLH
ncbi:unnamed protein product [Clavelina lepadiformis]|uniref:Uncharacterized protein n=1 Tax=Clavelina lepadiformis TaxID=159417 RepID=A0ABP0FLE8_CLALP